MTPRTLSHPQATLACGSLQDTCFISFILPGPSGSRDKRDPLFFSSRSSSSVSMSVCPGCLLSYKVEHGPLAHWPHLGTLLCSSRTQTETCMPKVTNSPSPGGLARTHVARPFPEFPSQ